MKSLIRYLRLSTITEGKWMIQYVENRFDDPVKNAVWNYVAGYTTGINNILRRRWKADSDYVKLLDSAFTKKSKVDVYRTVDWKYLENMYNITQESLKDFVGKKIQNRGYLSTSTKRKSPWGNIWKSDEVVLHIYSLKEISVIDVNEMFTSRDIDCVDQYEVILPRELEMSIKGYSVQDGTTFIEIEII